MGNFNQGGIEKQADAWNVAQGYTHLKILKPLVEMDKLVKISIYGVENIEDSLEVPEPLKVIMRIEAIKRLIDLLLEVIENTDFAMDKKTKDDLNSLYERVNNVNNVIDGISRPVSDQRTGETKTIINGDHFMKCLSELRSIKQELPKPLNKKGLIFPMSDEIDLERIKDQLIFGG